MAVRLYHMAQYRRPAMHVSMPVASLGVNRFKVLRGVAAQGAHIVGRQLRPLTVAVMGCAVNGPGEAREADFGVAGGDGKGLLFARGEIIGSVPEEEIVPALMKMMEEAMIEEAMIEEAE